MYVFKYASIRENTYECARRFSLRDACASLARALRELVYVHRYACGNTAVSYTHITHTYDVLARAACTGACASFLRTPLAQATWPWQCATCLRRSLCEVGFRLSGRRLIANAHARAPCAGSCARCLCDLLAPVPLCKRAFGSGSLGLGL